MIPSSHTSIHTATHAYPYTSYGAFHDQPQSSHPSAYYAFGLYEDPSSSTERWSDEYVGLGPFSDADRALFEAFLTAEVASISPPGPCTVVPGMQLPPAYHAEPAPTPRPLLTKSTQLHPELLDVSQPYPYAMPSSQSTVSERTFEQTSPKLTASPISPTAFSPFLDVYTQGGRSPTVVSEHSRAMSRHNQWSCPYPSPSPSPQTSSRVIAFNLRGVPAHASDSPIPLLPEPTVSYVSPDVVCPPVYCGYNPKDDRSSDVSPKSSRTSRRTTARSSPSAPYPTPSPEPSPRTSAIVFASQRRNSPARTAAPVASNPWQCPYCPHVQHNRRSPDLKRHIKTHTRGADVADWVCCGVPVLNAIELGVPAGTVREAQVFEFDGMPMIGGCRKAFSRRDALKRHLQREKGKCFGDALSLYQRGNRERC